jgi:hypothetical protein
MKKIEIIPFIGTSKYKLGEKFNDISESVKVVINKLNEKKAIDDIFSLKFIDDELIEISILESSNIFWENHNVFSDDFSDILKSQYEGIYKFGALIFDEIGLALFGFVEKEEQRTITVYKKGVWDEILNM